LWGWSPVSVGGGSGLAKRRRRWLRGEKAKTERENVGFGVLGVAKRRGP